MKLSITAFIALSVVLHLSVAVIFSFVTPSIIDVELADEHGSSFISLNLQNKTFIPIADNTKPDKPIGEGLSANHVHMPKNKVTPKTTTQTETAHDTPIVSAIKNPVAKNPRKISNPTFNIPDKKVPDHIKINQILHNELARHFYYPKVAQRRNWQGKVLIVFTVTPGGNITQAHVDTSSGYEILDRAALDALSKIKSAKQFSLALNGNSIEKTLPVIYELASR